MREIHGDSIYRPAPQVMAQIVSGKLVLLHSHTGKYFSLNRVGARVWELTDGHARARKIAETIASEYDAEESTVRADVMRLLGELSQQRLILPIQSA